MTAALLPLSADDYRTHALHSEDRNWTETNCYVDVWIEVLNALGLDPLAAGAFTLSSDFEGDQWSFFKFPPEDLRLLFGVEVFELNVWRPVLDHVVEQLGFGRLCTVEVDSWFLPDTRGVSYRTAHVKSTIVPQMVDADGRRLGYFHNAGYFELAGDDFDGVFRLGSYAGDTGLPPYVEVIRLDRIRRDDPELPSRVVELTRQHLARRPVDNPVTRLGQRLAADLPWLAAQDIETFHLYSFGMCRQCGASAELASSFVQWLIVNAPTSPPAGSTRAATAGDPGLRQAATSFADLAAGAKSLQFALARAVRGRRVDLEAVLTPMEANWADAMARLADHFGH